MKILLLLALTFCVTAQNNDKNKKCNAPILCSPPPRICSGNEQPTALPSTCCANCVLPSGLTTDCTSSAIAKCAPLVSTLRYCALGEQPIRNTTTCCLTCRAPPTSPCSKVDCAKSLPSLRYCDNGETPRMNYTTCCSSCRVRPLPEATPPPSGRCTPKQIALCMVNTTTCATDENPLVLPDSCCPSCKRAQSLCRPEVVVNCLSSLRTCDTGERPLVADGECCPSCQPPSPLPPRLCNPPCASTQRCIYVKRTANFSTVCRPLVRFQVQFRLSDVNRTDVTSYGPPQFKSLLQEWFQRWCEARSQSYLCQLLNAANAIEMDVINNTTQVDRRVFLDLETTSDAVTAADFVSSTTGNDMMALDSQVVRLDALADSQDTWPVALKEIIGDPYAADGVDWSNYVDYRNNPPASHAMHLNSPLFMLISIFAFVVPMLL